jgi:hypothetical protein
MKKYKKLIEEYEAKSLKLQKSCLAVFLHKIEELKKTCKHENAHWIEEISDVGIISSCLVKRCYDCNSNIDKLEIPEEFSKQLISKFDVMVEEYKQLHKEEKA